MLFGGGELGDVGLVPSDQAIQVVAVRAISSKLVLVKKPLDAAAKTDLIGMTLSAHRPTHLTVPTAPEDNHSGTCQPRGKQTPRPKPTPLLLISHRTENL